MPLAAGTRLGSYEIEGPLGAGGMGEVYRARDTKLGRDVAIKVLPEAFAEDSERLARFEREAKLLASLNHPNIAAIYGIGSHQPERSAQRSGVAEREVVGVGPHDTNESPATHYFVLELVEGPTLAERIQQGPVPVGEAIAIATQVAEALEAGHQAGIIHRDLKPANVKLKEDGTVKVLDYGLAKALEGESSPSSDSQLSQSPTLTRQGTQIGVILGTAAYMSPEQAKGKRVDERTDVFAFGSVLYEMLTGKRAFGGDAVSETLGAVIQSEPDFGALPADTPAACRRALELCLKKDVKERVRNIGDVALAIRGAFVPEGETATTRPKRPAWIGLGLVALASGALTWGLTRSLRTSEATPRPVTRFTFSTPPGEAVTGGRLSFAISSDGSRLVYGANDQLYLRSMDEAVATLLRNTEGGRYPFFSPDGAWVAFWKDGEIQKVPAAGGAAVSLGTAPGEFEGGWWGDDGTIVFARETAGLYRIPASGGAPELALPNEAGSALYAPQILPGGDWVLSTYGPMGEAASGESSIVAQSLASGERRVLIEHAKTGRYLASGHLAYVSDGTLFLVPFDRKAMQATGAALPMVEQVRTDPILSVADYAVSESGTLVYLIGSAQQERTLVWVDRQGNETALSAPPGAYAYPRISPDGKRIVLDVRDADSDLWVWEIGRETLVRLTFGSSRDVNPYWSPDGAHVAFSSDRDGGVLNLFWKAADGSEEAERLSRDEHPHILQGFTSDGRGAGICPDWMGDSPLGHGNGQVGAAAGVR